MDRQYYFFYVLHCQDGTLYAGYTTDLKRRLDTHNKGKGAKYTQVTSRRPVKMIYAERWNTKREAMRAEALFKRLSRTQKESYLEANGQSIKETATLVLVNREEE